MPITFLTWLQTWLRNPKVIFILLLSLFYGVTAFHLPAYLSVSLVIFSVWFMVLADLLFTYLRKSIFFIPYSAIISGLILALIVDQGATWPQLLIMALVAMAGKNFLRVKDRHIFNPVATALLVGWTFFQLQPSWWGASLYTPGKITWPNVLVLGTILALGYVSCVKYRKTQVVFSYLGSMAVASWLVGSFATVAAFINTVFSPGNLFYAIVMVAEPKTSPVRPKRQMVYGAGIGLVGALLVLAIQNGLLPANLLDSSLIALLIGNLSFFLYR